MAKKMILWIVSLLLIFGLVFTASADNSRYEQEFRDMSLEDLQAVSELLNGIINEKKIGNAVLIVDPSEATLAAGKNIKLTVTSDAREVTPKTVLTYESSDENVAAIKNGQVVGVGEGSAEIKVRAVFEDGATLETTSKINVIVPVTAINAPKQATAFVGGELNLGELISLTPENATDKKIKYSAEDNTVISINENGLIKGLKGGTTTVTVESVQENPAVKSAQIKVSVNEAVGSITLSEKAFSVGKGSNYKLEATVSPDSATNQAVEWTSENKEIATVSPAGIVTGKGTGTTKIVCTAKDGSGVSAMAEVKVITAVSSITFDRKDICLISGNSSSVKWEVMPKDASNKGVKLKSSDISVAEIGDNGVIRAKGVGTCVITAEAMDGSNKSGKLTVYVEPVNPISVNSIHWQTTWGVKNGRMGVVGTSNCVHKKVKAFRCRVNCKTWGGTTTEDSVFYSGKAISPGKNGKSKLSSSSISGFTMAVRVMVTVVSVTFDDGTVYDIPSSAQVTTYFDM